MHFQQAADTVGVPGSLPGATGSEPHHTKHRGRDSVLEVVVFTGILYTKRWDKINHSPVLSTGRFFPLVYLSQLWFCHFYGLL